MTIYNKSFFMPGAWLISYILPLVCYKVHFLTPNTFTVNIYGLKCLGSMKITCFLYCLHTKRSFKYKYIEGQNYTNKHKNCNVFTTRLVCNWKIASWRFQRYYKACPWISLCVFKHLWHHLSILFFNIFNATIFIQEFIYLWELVWKSFLWYTKH